MHDQGIEPWSPLGGKHRRHGAGVGRIRTKAVDGLGWKRHQPAGGERRRAICDCLRRCRCHGHLCHHTTSYSGQLLGAATRGSYSGLSSLELSAYCAASVKAQCQAARGLPMTYQAPVDDIMHALKSAAGLDELMARGLLGDLDEATIRAVIEEAGKFGAEVLDPLSPIGDRSGSKLIGGQVETPPGWREAYRQFAAGGWGALAAPEQWGGQNLPSLVATVAGEIWNSANLGFGLCPLLTLGAIDAIEAEGSEELKDSFLPKMVSGEWSGTMNLIEPHAGSDLSQLKTRAVKQADGSYRIFGTKIFITYGDHELTDNIIHLVLARLPDAPPGTRGVSLFLVPKILVNADGSLGAHNDVVCAGVEHKLGIHASPTCVMKYGEKGEGAVGYLVGEENRGLNVMFIMMNEARLAVGMQGVEVEERATQRALGYARERRQGRSLASTGADMSPIIEHA